jgi:LCP family protein required for cell wall assembly
MVVGIDRDRNRVAVLSIPRDLYVDIPYYGWSRINTADYIGERVLPVEGGGPALVSEILNNTFGISTDHWVRVEMNGFVDMVDAIGGVTVHLDCPFYEPIYNLTTEQWEYFTLPAGDVYMDGETAYWFVRLRLRESDIGRAQRQRQFLWALRDQASAMNLLLRFPELWSAFNDTFTTDLSMREMIDYAQFALSLDAGNVRAAGISLRDLESFTTDKGASVLRIGDPGRVQAVVEGIWDAPAMADAYRQDATNCRPIPTDLNPALAVPPETRAAVEAEAQAEAGTEQPATE